MAKASVGRVLLAVITGWLTNAILTGIAEVLMWRSMRGPGGHFPLRYYVIDVICQCCFTILGAYLCCVIAGSRHRVAMISLMALGLLVGGLSLPPSWSREPHWYRIALLAVWVPCVWIGCKLSCMRAVTLQRLEAK